MSRTWSYRVTLKITEVSPQGHPRQTTATGTAVQGLHGKCVSPPLPPPAVGPHQQERASFILAAGRPSHHPKSALTPVFSHSDEGEQQAALASSCCCDLPGSSAPGDPELSKEKNVNYFQVLWCLAHS